MRLISTTRDTTVDTYTLAIIIFQAFSLPYTLLRGYVPGPPTDLTTHMNFNRVPAVLLARWFPGTREAARETGQHDDIEIFV